MLDRYSLQLLINEIQVLIEKRVTSETPDFITWKTKTDLFLRKHFGENSKEEINFHNIGFSPMAFPVTQEDRIDICKSGLERSGAVLTAYLDVIEDSTNNEAQSKNITDNSDCFEKVFIVHGHDEALRESVASIIRQQDIDAIILNKKANRGKTIIEKIEANSDVSAAVCLFTADDLGKAKTETDYKKRARQNVVFEAGYFIGKLGRENVVVVVDSDIELPSDLNGVVYTNREKWEIDLLRELKAIGYNIDFNKLYE